MAVSAISTVIELEPVAVRACNEVSGLHTSWVVFEEVDVTFDVVEKTLIGSNVEVWFIIRDNDPVA